ncbi:hypothetical protein JCM10908_005970 [Rhodotorula pacifica]|uniref:uncharacterized protein n=1 Tax=Rhodotorula pacifica TaxID=1495444 RepID=UPI00316C2DC2
MSTFLVFPPDQPLKWPKKSDLTASEALLLDKKETVFNLQRALNDSTLQLRTKKVIDKEIASFSKSSRVEVNAYLRFCKLASVPPYPVNSALTGLCLLAKRGAGLKSTWWLESVTLRMKFDQVHQIFREQPYYKRLLQLGREVEDVDQANSGTDDEDEDEHKEEEERSEITSTSSSTPADHLQVVNAAQLPQPGDTFSSVDEAHLACALALLNSHRNAARVFHQTSTNATIRCNRASAYYKDTGQCQFRIQLELVNQQQYRNQRGQFERQEQWVVDRQSSNYTHNHGPDARKLSEPNWLPLIRMPNVRQALGMPPLTGARKKRKKATQNRQHETDYDSESSEDSADEEDEVVARPVAKKRRVVDREKPRVAGPSSVRQKQTPSAQSAISPSTPRPGLETIQAFFASTSPRFVPLAHLAYDAGLKTTTDLGNFACLSPGVRTAFLNAIKKEAKELGLVGP